MENSKLLKQQFLKNEIVDKNYNPDYFLKFIEDRCCGDNFNLDQWSLDDLKKIVSLYKARWIDRSQFEEPWVIKSIEQIDQLHSNKKDFPMDDALTEELNEINKIFQDVEVGLLKKEILEKEKITTEGFIFQEKNKKEELVDCVKLENTSITGITNLSFEASNPELVKEGFLFSSTYLQYQIHVMPMNLLITRKETDFEWLYKRLSSLYPDIILPPCRVKSKDDSSTKMIYISMFLNELGRIKLIRSTKIFEAFITFPKNEFIAAQRVFDKEESPKKINERSNLEGKINVAISNEVQLKNSMFELDKKKQALEHLKKAILKVAEQFNQLSLVLKEISNCYIDIRNSYFNSPKLYQSFDNLSQVMQNWGQGYKEKADFFKNDLYIDYKYMLKENKNVEPFLTQYKSMKTDFDSLSKKYISPTLQAKNIFDKKMLNLKMMFGFSSNILCEEIDSLMDRQHERITKQMEKIKKDNNKVLSEYSMILKLLSNKQ